MDYKEKVKEKEGEWSGLFKRMDTDKDLVNLAKYTLIDADKHKIPHAISVTLNDPAVFAANVEASLNKASEQVAVEADDKKIDTSYIEDFVRTAFREVDSKLTKRGMWALNPYLDQQMCRRGRGAARCLVHIVNGVPVLDVAEWDTRFVTYGMGPDGKDWAAYKTVKTKDMIESERWAQEIEFTISGKTATVLDVWSKNHNEIWVADKKVYEQEHSYGYVPVVIQVVSLGSMLADEDSIKYQGESIFFLIRDLIPELNRLVSTIQSLNVKALDSAMQWKSEAGEQIKSENLPSYDDLTSPGSVTAADKGGGAEQVPYGELKRSAWLLHSMIETRIQRGSLSNFDLGTFTQPMSAVALIEIGEGRDQVFLPRLGARGLLKQQLAEMIIDQTINSGQSNIEIGVGGHKQSFNVGKLDGAYELEFNYFVKSPKIDIARYSMAAAVGDLLPDRVKRRDILQREDPDDDEEWLRWEEAENLSPLIKMNRTIKALQEKGEDFEAELMKAQMKAVLGQMKTGVVPESQKRQKPQPLIPLMGGGSARKAAESEAPPESKE